MTAPAPRPGKVVVNQGSNCRVGHVTHHISGKVELLAIKAMKERKWSMKLTIKIRPINSHILDGIFG